MPFSGPLPVRRRRDGASSNNTLSARQSRLWQHLEHESGGWAQSGWPCGEAMN